MVMITGTETVNNLVEDPLTGEEEVWPTASLRWLGSNKTTTEPRRLQQLFMVRRLRKFSVVNAEPEWRDVPFHLED